MAPEIVLNHGGRRIGLGLGRRGLEPGRPVLLLVHGSGGSHLTWRGQLNALDRRVNVAAVDLPGHGRSDGPPAGGLEEYAAWLARTVEVLGLPTPPVVAGLSLGGAVALEAVLIRPELFSGLILVSTAARPRVEDGLVQSLKKDYPAGLARLARLLFSPDNAEQFAGQSLEILRAAPRELVLADLSAGRGFDRSRRLEEIEQPTLIIHGEKDQLVGPEEARFLAEGIPGARLVVIEGAGHLIHVEKFREFNRTVLDFLAEIGGAT
ncbi:MAG: alpha/beta hydrolase [Thermodesulfobacteriota bacterium]